MRLNGAVVLLTGASSGIGAAAATRLARVGARLVLSGRDQERLAALASQLDAHAVVADLTEPDAAAGLVARASEPHGRIDVLISNAGAGWAGAFATMPPEDLDRVVALNLLAPARLARAVLPGMLTRGCGHLVFVSSIAGYVGVREEAAYAAAKAGLNTLAESLRLEVAAAGLSVSVLAPGVVDTEFFQRRGVPYRRGTPKPIPAGVVADALVRAVERDQAETFTPGWLRLPARLRGAVPGVFRAGASRFG
jgi:short-subunit dehydrogenase